MAAGAFEDGGRELVPAIGVRGGGREHIEQHGLDDEAVVIIPVEVGAVAVDAVALILGEVLTDGVVDTHEVGFAGEA